MMRRYLTALAIVFGLSLHMAKAEAQTPKGFEGFTPSEQWVATMVASGNQANLTWFCSQYKINDPVIPNIPKQNPPNDCHRLSAEFLLKLLDDNSSESGASAHPVDILGAWFPDQVVVTGREYPFSLTIRQSRFDQPFYAQHTKIGGSLILNDNWFQGIVQADHLSVDGGLDFTGSKFDQSLDASASQVAQDMLLNGAQIKRSAMLGEINVKEDLMIRENAVINGNLNIVDASIGGSLYICGSNFHGGINGQALRINGGLCAGSSDSPTDKALHIDGGPVNLADARIDGYSHFQNVELSGALILQNATILGGVVIARNTTLHKEFILSSAHVVGNIYIQDVKALDGISALSLNLDGRLILRGTYSPGYTDFMQSRITGSVELGDATFSLLDFSGATIAGDLDLGNFRNKKPAQWIATQDQPIPRLFLIGTHVGAIQDLDGDGQNSWPSYLDLQGFSYDRLGGSQENTQYPMSARRLAWFQEWESKDSVFNFQNYRQLADVLRAAGNPTRADRILFLGRERQRSLAWQHNDYSSFALLTALRVFINYGLRPWFIPFVLGWMTVFTLIGAVITYFSLARLRRHVGEIHAKKDMLWCIGASLDRLIPVVELNKEFGDHFHDPEREHFRAWECQYFAFHILMGWVLMSFIIAALAGLTQAQ